MRTWIYLLTITTLVCVSSSPPADAAGLYGPQTLIPSISDRLLPIAEVCAYCAKRGTVRKTRMCAATLNKLKAKCNGELTQVRGQ